MLNTAVSIVRTQNMPRGAEEVIETAKELEPYIYELRFNGEDFEDVPFLGVILEK